MVMDPSCTPLHDFCGMDHIHFVAGKPKSVKLRSFDSWGNSPPSDIFNVVARFDFARIDSGSNDSACSVVGDYDSERNLHHGVATLYDAGEYILNASLNRTLIPGSPFLVVVYPSSLSAQKSVIVSYDVTIVAGERSAILLHLYDSYGSLLLLLKSVSFLPLLPFLSFNL